MSDFPELPGTPTGSSYIPVGDIGDYFSSSGSSTENTTVLNEYINTLATIMLTFKIHV